MIALNPHDDHNKQLPELQPMIGLSINRVLVAIRDLVFEIVAKKL